LDSLLRNRTIIEIAFNYALFVAVGQSEILNWFSWFVLLHCSAHCLHAHDMGGRGNNLTLQDSLSVHKASNHNPPDLKLLLLTGSHSW